MNKGNILILILLLFSSGAGAQTNGNKGITFQGVIKDNSNPASPVFPSVTSNVVVQILGVRSDGNSCILWEEIHSGVQIEKGYLYLVVGRGNKTAQPALSFKDVFNDKPKTSLTCSNGFTDYTPLATDSRKLRVVVSSLGITADFNMRSAPLAVHAESAGSAENLNGKASADFINVNTPGGLTQNAAETWFGSTVMGSLLAGTYNAPTATTAANVSGVVAVANGGTGASTAAGARTNLGLGPLAVMNPTGTADATTYLRGDGVWTGLPSAPTLAGDVSGAVGTNTVDKIKGTAVNTTALSNGHFLRFDSGAWINGALLAADVPALDWAKITTGKPTNLAGYGITDAVNKNGDTMAGALNMGSNDLTATGYILMSPQRALGLGTYTNAQETTLVGTLNVTHKGYAWFNSDANQVKIWNGSAAQALGIAGSGITSFGGQSGNSQALAIGTAGNSPAWSSASNTHTLNIPMASGASVTAGLISKAEYDTFNGKLSATITAPLAGHHLRYNGSAWANSLVTLSSDVTGTLSIANGGTGATSAGSARTSLGLLSAATRDTGAVSGNVPLVGVSGITANKMCTSDGTSSIICNTNIPSSQWTSSASDIYFNTGKVAIGATAADRNLTVVNNSTGQGAISIQNSSSSGISSVEFFNSGGAAEGFVGWANSGASGVNNAVVLGSNGVREITLFTNNTKVLSAFPAGNVGIGVAGDPGVKLKVNGTIASGSVSDASPTTFDMSLGNYQYTTTGCSGATWDLQNLVEGASYTIAVQSATHTGPCVFSGSGVAFRYQPSNTMPVSGHAIYTFVKLGTIVYVSWIEGFN